VVATIVFSILHLIPGDPAVLLSSSGGALPPPEAIEALREKMGLNRPILEQYLGYLGGLLQGNLGRSFTDGYPIADEIATRLPRTIELIVAATVLAIAVGLPLGTLAAKRRGRWPDRLLSAMAGLQLSMPVFVLGTLLILLFAQTLRWVPAGGYARFSEDPLQHLVHLSMPAFTIAVGLSAVIFRMVRTTVIETLERDWVRTARAKGLARKAVLRRHVVRNALGPVLTVVGLSTKKASRGVRFPLSQLRNSSRCHRPTRLSANSAARRHVRPPSLESSPVQRNESGVISWNIQRFSPSRSSPCWTMRSPSRRPTRRVKAPFGGFIQVTFQEPVAGS
jgi:peptide/nickel transport system permease protein